MEKDHMRDDVFFENTPRETFQIDGQSVEFPVFYYDYRFLTCVVTAKSDKLNALLPHPEFKVAELWPGSGVLSMTAFEYRDTDLGPYNEVAISIPMYFPHADFVPEKSAIAMVRKNIFSMYVHQLPVTTEIARRGGVYFYNFPKFIADISFEDVDDKTVVVLKEKDDLILKITANKIPMKKSIDFEYHTFSMRDNLVLHSLIEGRAPKFGQIAMGRFAELELGGHPLGIELKEIGVGNIANNGLYAENAMCKLHYPSKQWNAETLELVSC
jgi:hypothetical protein